VKGDISLFTFFCLSGNLPVSGILQETTDLIACSCFTFVTVIYAITGIV